MNLFGDANYLLNENKGYVKQSEFTTTWHVFFCFKAISTITYISLNRVMQTLMSPKFNYFNHVREQGLYRMTQSRAFLNVKQLGQKYCQQ